MHDEDALISKSLRWYRRRSSFAATVSRVLIVLYVVATLVVIEATLQDRGGVNLWERAAMVAVFLLLVFPVIDLVSRARNDRRLSRINADLARKVTTLNESILELSAKSRQELATWLHSEAQGKLLHLAFMINLEFDECRAALEEAVSASRTSDERLRLAFERLDHLQQFIGLQLDEFNEGVLRKRAHDMYPPALTIGLDFALRQLLSGTASLSIDPRLTIEGTIGVKSDEASDDADIRESLNSKLSERLVVSSELKYAIFRCVEEGLNNALKHRARNISVSVEIDNLWIVCRVENDGDPLPAEFKSGFGLVMVDTLVKDLNGDWSLKTVGSRTVFTLKFPKPMMTAAQYLKLLEGADV